MENYIDASNLDPLHQGYVVVLTDLLTLPSFYYENCIKELNNINLENIINYYKDFFEILEVSQLILGNISPKDA